MAKNKYVLFASIDEEGRLTFDNAAEFAKARGLLRGRQVQVLIEPRKKPRSLQENGYYWGVVLELLSKWSGYSKEEMHDALRGKFLCVFSQSVGLEMSKSTSALSTVEFEQYLSDVRQWASEQGVFIPLPNEEIY
jgi:hypothetical protein|nr:MAG TPA: Putative HNHc nuclease [Caudoviricetes sp.]